MKRRDKETEPTNLDFDTHRMMVGALAEHIFHEKLAEARAFSNGIFEMFEDKYGRVGQVGGRE